MAGEPHAKCVLRSSAARGRGPVQSGLQLCALPRHPPVSHHCWPAVARRQPTWAGCRRAAPAGASSAGPRAALPGPAARSPAHKDGSIGLTEGSSSRMGSCLPAAAASQTARPASGVPAQLAAPPLGLRRRAAARGRDASRPPPWTGWPPAARCASPPRQTRPCSCRGERETRERCKGQPCTRERASRLLRLAAGGAPPASLDRSSIASTPHTLTR